MKSDKSDRRLVSREVMSGMLLKKLYERRCSPMASMSLFLQLNVIVCCIVENRENADRNARVLDYERKK